MKKWIVIATVVAVAVPTMTAAQQGRGGGRIFAMLDSNGDGKLDKAEFTRMAEMRAERQGDPSLASPARIDAMIKNGDANGDGFVDRAEFDAMRTARAAQGQPKSD